MKLLFCEKIQLAIFIWFILILRNHMKLDGILSPGDVNVRKRLRPFSNATARADGVATTADRTQVWGAGVRKGACSGWMCWF